MQKWGTLKLNWCVMCKTFYNNKYRALCSFLASVLVVYIFNSNITTHYPGTSSVNAQLLLLLGTFSNRPSANWFCWHHETTDKSWENDTANIIVFISFDVRLKSNCFFLAKKREVWPAKQYGLYTEWNYQSQQIQHNDTMDNSSAMLGKK